MLKQEEVPPRELNPPYVNQESIFNFNLQSDTTPGRVPYLACTLYPHGRQVSDIHAWWPQNSNSCPALNLTMEMHNPHWLIFNWKPKHDSIIGGYFSIAKLHKTYYRNCGTSCLVFFSIVLILLFLLQALLNHVTRSDLLQKDDRNWVLPLSTSSPRLSHTASMAAAVREATGPVSVSRSIRVPA